MFIFYRLIFFFIIFSIGNYGKEAEGQNKKFDVGLKIITKTDSSRSFNNKNNPAQKFREIKFYVWYPAVKRSNTESNNVLNYIEQMADDFQIRDAKNQPDANELLETKMLFLLNEKEMINKLMKSKIEAQFNAGIREDKFPLIIVGQGYSYESPVSQATMCEYLASRGYIVASSPLMGVKDYKTAVTTENLEVYYFDLMFIKKVLTKWKNVNKEKIAVSGFDLGGMAALLMQMNDDEIKALVSIDSGICIEQNLRLFDNCNHFKPEKFQVPFLHITRSKEGNESLGLTENLDLINSNKSSEKYLLRIKNMRHIDFTSFNHWGLTENVSLYGGKAIGEPRKAYVKIIEMLANYYDFILNNCEEEWESFINGLNNNVPEENYFSLE